MEGAEGVEVEEKQKEEEEFEEENEVLQTYLRIKKKYFISLHILYLMHFYF